MNQKKVGTSRGRAKHAKRGEKRSFRRPKWVKGGEEWLCPECYKAVGERNRYKLICILGRSPAGFTVSSLTKALRLKQPTVTHHLQTLREVDAVETFPQGRERIYKLNRDAHCFEECKIPY
ncbi:MAG: helix-turn-helix domain-containing protein [Patescibacteria group bacterium]